MMATKMTATQAAAIIRDDPNIKAVLEKAEAINLALSYLDGEREEASRYLEGVSDGYREYQQQHCWYMPEEFTPRTNVPVLVSTDLGYYVASYTEDGNWKTSEGAELVAEVKLWKFIEEKRW